MNKYKDVQLVSVQENEGKITVDIMKDGTLITIYIEGKIVNPFEDATTSSTTEHSQK